MSRRASLLVTLVLWALWAVPAAHADFGIAPGSLSVKAEEAGGTLDVRAGVIRSPTPSTSS